MATKSEFWQHNLDLKDITLNKLTAGTNVSYVGRRIYSASPRKVTVSLGSDDGFELYVNGRSVKQRNIERSLAANQDVVEVSLETGLNSLVLKIINTGGDAGFYYRYEPINSQWPTDLLLALVPSTALVAESSKRLKDAWRVHYSPGFREKQKAITDLEQLKADIEAKTPLTMVMHELPQPKTTYVLTRGAYDKPDMKRPVERTIPASLGNWPTDQPRSG